MIIPQPKDLPPRSQTEGSKLTSDVQNLSQQTDQYNLDIDARFQQSNTQLQFLSEQVRELGYYVDFLPGSAQVYNTRITNIAPTTSWSTVLSLNIALPPGYVSCNIFALGSARIVDTTSPYITNGLSRFLVNGDPQTAISQRYPWNGVPPENLANNSVTVSATSDVTLSFQLIEDQVVQPASYSYAQISAFAVFYTN